MGRYLDGRYFYVDESGYGRSTCGIARAHAWRCIQQLQAVSQYVSPEWLIRLRLAKSNPSVRGFIFEKIVIAHLIGRPAFNQPLRLVDFSGKYPAPRISTAQHDQTCLPCMYPLHSTTEKSTVLLSASRRIRKASILAQSWDTDNMCKAA